MTTQGRQMSDSYRIALLLALSGGFMDAYTYFLRGGVFANGQTGNIILFALNLYERNYARSVQYFVPICAFAAGILAAAVMRSRCLAARFHWRQQVVMTEILIMVVVGIIPLGQADIAANSMVSFVSAMQFETFKKMRGDNYASVFCTGNLRSAMEQFYLWADTREKLHFYRFLRYIGILVIFVGGVVLCAALVPYFQIRTIWVSIVFLILVCALMSRQEVE